MSRNWFSNFVDFDQPLVYEGISYQCPETFYQAMKVDRMAVDCQQLRQRISLMSALESKRFSKTITVRANWDDVKLLVMWKALHWKFAPGTKWSKVLSNCDVPIVEKNYWHDNFWGSCTCDKCGDTGKNMLGKMLMAIRNSKDMPKE